ncbi:MAG: Gfo/Idh/MocA family oxidoreductase, partial [Candidatus Hydrogenedentes bacterium]|nr:Gfo/Idh/MocA family oxidoreductase [Candidatus Hydrogenedentota bacterium]
MANPTTRRDFLKTTAGAAATLSALGYTRSAGANDRLSIGLIGCGSRGRGSHMPSINHFAKELNVEITAVCDPWGAHRREAAAMCTDWFGKEPRQYTSYKELLDQKDIDIVSIACCDHQHATVLQHAAEAKKDAYCEKPLAKNLEELKAAYDAVKANKVVVQAGTQIRSLPSVAGAQKLYAEGVLGKVARIEQLRNASRPYWYQYIREVQEDDVDWAEFLFGLPMRPFDPVLCSGWYGHREFSDGPIPGLASHYIDLVHYITGAKFPKSCVAMSGTDTWIDEHNFDAPDHVNAVWEYEDGFKAYYSTNFGNGSGSCFKIYGNKGVLDLTNWSRILVSGEGAQGETDLPAKPAPVDEIDRPDHMEDWLQCVRNRKAPNADIDAGYQHAVAVLMAVTASDTGQRQVYDQKTRTIKAG